MSVTSAVSYNLKVINSDKLVQLESAFQVSSVVQCDYASSETFNPRNKCADEFPILNLLLTHNLF